MAEELTTAEGERDLVAEAVADVAAERASHRRSRRRWGILAAVVAVLAVLVAAALLVRLFILFHDCVHGSLFRAKGANTFFGYLLGMLVFTPFEDWRFSHLRHHVSYANLDTRGYGDIWTMTRTEFEHASKWGRFAYRLYRSLQDAKRV